LVPDAFNLLKFSVEGNGFIAGSDNGNQNDPVSLKIPERNAFYGKAVVCAQNNGEKGAIELTATTTQNGIQLSAKVSITVQ
jgi:beta-galactosidase